MEYSQGSQQSPKKIRPVELPKDYSTSVGSLSDFMPSNNIEDSNKKQMKEDIAIKKMDLGHLKLFSLEENEDEQLPDDGAHDGEEGSVSSRVSIDTKCCIFTKEKKNKIDRMFPTKAPWDHSSDEEAEEGIDFEPEVDEEN